MGASPRGMRRSAPSGSLPRAAGLGPTGHCGSHRYVLSSACIRCEPSCPASSATDQQSAFTAGDSADRRVPKATSTLRCCASTSPSTALTRASTLAVQSATSSMCWPRGRVVNISSTKQAARHGRLKFTSAHVRPIRLPSLTVTLSATQRGRASAGRETRTLIQACQRPDPLG
jgi:hypothetical protein